MKWTDYVIIVRYIYRSLVVRYIRLSSKTVVIALLLLAISADTPQKSLVVKRPVFTTIFTTNDVLRMLRFAAICRVSPEF